jgi:hypothetical protein
MNIGLIIKVMAKDKYTIRITKYCPDLLFDLQAQADILNISLNKLIIIILTNYLKKYKNDRIK